MPSIIFSSVNKTSLQWNVKAIKRVPFHCSLLPWRWCAVRDSKKTACVWQHSVSGRARGVFQAIRPKLYIGTPLFDSVVLHLAFIYVAIALRLQVHVNEEALIGWTIEDWCIVW